MARPVDIKTQRFGRLIAIERASPNRHGQAYWICQCDCGATTTVASNNLRRGLTTSCGCYRRYVTATQDRTRSKHGMYKSSEYSIWHSLKDRCLSKSSASWKNYGGRGITICPTWIRSFEAFYQDMGPRPSPNHSIDRIDNNGPYSKANCRWATTLQQARNRRNTKRITFNGANKVLSEWAIQYGLPWGVVDGRLRLGWSIDRALTTPVRRHLVGTGTS
jgi:hypothetical protein